MFYLLKMSLENASYIFFAAQILLESLPVSSSGHVLLLKYILDVQPELYIDTVFEYFSYVGTFIVWLVFFYKDWLAILKRSFSSFYNFINVFFYFLIIGIMMAFWLFICNFKINIPIYYLMALTALVLYLSTIIKIKNEINEVSFSLKNALVLGFAQGFAILPGVSRFGLTYSVAKFLGFSNRVAILTSIMIFMPVVALLAIGSVFKLTIEECSYLVLNFKFITFFVVSCILSYLIFYLTQYLLLKNKAWIFSIYLLIVAVGVFLLGR